MLVVPAAISLLLLWWNGSLLWMCWTVAAAGALAGVCIHAMFRKRADFQREVAVSSETVRTWELFAGLSLWTHWFICLAGIILALVIRRNISMD
jgi:hypothetical protein